MYVIDRVPDVKFGEDVKKYCSQVGGDEAGEGGVFIITSDNEPCAVLISMAEYEDYRGRRNKEYFDKLRESEAQIARGECVALTLEQLK